ncbi:fucose 4-O-acetylase-like acetyltransferase [Agromyces terreus]|uniref:Fucose 4-O-acetylase-like acetyltransferase n=1 Tax=Agromyces terreus TaxID=424795 RepID=A0A9X2KAN0_9MICO|nr:acyltransferase [Agromyces terreus]MCP2369446.1 fucose 4-O-acetylase-like acetyltransferase [Agromyces terreus]
MTAVDVAAPRPTRRRDLSIESLRGLAIVLMVAGHVIGGDGSRGMTVADDSLWRWSYVFLEDIRMPLFAALSGFVYAFRPVSTSAGYGRMVTGKVRRLLVPLVTVGTAFFVLQTVVPGTNVSGSASEIWRVYLYGTGHFWFLQAIFLIFLAVGVLDLLGLLRRRRSWIVAVAASSVLYVAVLLPEAWDVFSVNGAIRLLPFFLLGYGVHRFVANPPPLGLLVPTAAAFVAVYALRVLDIAGVVDLVGAGERASRIAVGLAATLLLLLMRDRIRVGFLAWLGPFAFAIYLLHVFGSAAARLALGRAGIDGEIVVFVVCMLAALGLPILFEVTLGRIRWVSWAFLGQKPWKPRPKARPSDGPAEPADEAAPRHPSPEPADSAAPPHPSPDPARQQERA